LGFGFRGLGFGVWGMGLGFGFLFCVRDSDDVDEKGEAVSALHDAPGKGMGVPRQSICPEYFLSPRSFSGDGV
jgi:hypothetical protein